MIKAMSGVFHYFLLSSLAISSGGKKYKTKVITAAIKSER